ncbi:hypothetical protein ACA910_012507 [Epithemia clementina (nom. ined.)]
MLLRRWSCALAVYFALRSRQSVCRGDVSFATAYQVNALGEVHGNIENSEETTPTVSTVHKQHRNTSDNPEPKPHASLECGIWLAPSALVGAGLGMYAGKAFKKGDPLQHTGDLCVPIIDIWKHNMEHPFQLLWDEYTWSAESLNMTEEGFYEVNGASPGFGATANSFLPLVNVDELQPRRDHVGLHRAKDPGAGAFTPYYDRGSVAERDIKVGEELYVSYGEAWFKARPHLGPIPLTKDLDRATILFRGFLNMKNRLAGKVNDSVFDELWNTFVRESSYNTTSRVIGSFHHDDKEEMALLEELKSVRKLRLREATRSQQWLEQHGTCGDHIQAGPSTLKQAGHGGFASRYLPEGTIVAQLPLIHVINRTRFDMYHFLDDDPETLNVASKRPPQLMVNYCYGHHESSLLLCPYGPMVNYVNHNQTLANVRLQWADPERGNFMPHLLNASLEALESDSTAKLAFEFVATRPIAEGEEIFFDYGDEWEEAWQKHVESWTAVDGSDEYRSADDLNLAIKAGEVEFHTEFDIMKYNLPSVPSNVRLACNNYFSDDLWLPSYESGTLAEELEEHNSNSVEYFYCYILRIEKSQATGELLYTVEAHNDEETDFFLWKGPIDIFHFLDKPYSSDIFLENAFRHDIRIPDAMFPDAWRKLAPDFDGDILDDRITNENDKVVKK